MVTVPAMIFHTFISAERYFPAITRVILQKERETQDAGILITSADMRIAAQQMTAYYHLVERPPLTVIAVGTSRLAVHQII